MEEIATFHVYKFRGEIAYHIKKKKSPVMQTKDFSFREPKAGLEPATYALRMRCSTN